jgi:FtsZ-binding cell division protein ZapB
VSQPKRYDFGMTVESCPTTGFHETRPWVYETEHGMYVKHADYAALQAENERLTKERDHYQWASTNDGIACNERARENQDLENQIDALKAENERLRKAGDEMAEHFEGFSEWMENADGSPYVSSRLKAWLAAKGVKS